MAQSTYGVLHVEGEGVVGYSIPVNLDPLCKAVVRKKCLGGGGGGGGGGGANSCTIMHAKNQLLKTVVKVKVT